MTAELYRRVLGVEIGDKVIAEAWKRPEPIKVEGMDVYATDKRVTFSVWRLCYRKDRLPQQTRGRSQNPLILGNNVTPIYTGHRRDEHL